MSRTFATFLVVSGVASAAVLVFPGLVLIGLFLGILPGIALAFMPTVFLYAVLWYGVRWLLLRAFAARAGTAPRHVSGLAAAVCIAVPAFALPPLLNASTVREATALRAEDQNLDSPLVLPPVVAVVMPHVIERREQIPACEEVCQRLLFNRVVARVIMTESPPPGRAERASVAAFWIERRDACPAPAMNQRQIAWRNDFPLRRGEDPRSRALARVAAGECLIRGAGMADEAGATIAYRTIKSGSNMFAAPWSPWLDTVTAHRLEVLERGGRVLYRRTEVTAEPLVTPLRIGTAAGLLTTVTYAGWARSKETYEPLGPNGRDVLPALLGEGGRQPDLVGVR